MAAGEAGAGSVRGNAVGSAGGSRVFLDSGGLGQEAGSLSDLLLLQILDAEKVSSLSSQS